MDVYSRELKQLIGKLNDDTLDVMGGQKSKMLNKAMQKGVAGDGSSNMNDNQTENDDPNKAFKGQESRRAAKERKEKLQIQVMNESQTYYQNNMNIFSNGLSLLSINSLEVHGMLHQAGSQLEEMDKLVKNINAHSRLMKDKTENMLGMLMEIDSKLNQ